MPTQRDDRYNAIKKLCYVEQPVASQVTEVQSWPQEMKGGKMPVLPFHDVVLVGVEMILGGERQNVGSEETEKRLPENRPAN